MQVHYKSKAQKSIKNYLVNRKADVKIVRDLIWKDLHKRKAEGILKFQSFWAQVKRIDRPILIGQRLIIKENTEWAINTYVKAAERSFDMAVEMIWWSWAELKTLYRFFTNPHVEIRVKAKAAFILRYLYIPFTTFVVAYVYHFHIAKDMVQQQNAKSLRPLE